MIGSRLAHYDIVGHLGSGGMGDVYQATDSKLGRRVAIKLLPDVFSRDTERVARFEREARVLASLNHPNIAAIYGFEQSGGRSFLVMELVEGETLAQRIARGALSLDEALPIAKQIAEALAAAHEKGVVHRDLKPANIEITPEGRVKVLDFGLAKIFASEDVPGDVSNSPTLLSMRTGADVILGTAAYMSPEQARGKNVDRRTDIFAFGCVLYEMLTRQQAFRGEAVADIISAVMRAEPDWVALPPDLPPAISLLLRSCLKKDAKQRLGDASAIAVIIDDATAEPVTQASAVVQRRSSLPPLILIAAASLLIGAFVTSRLKPRSVPGVSGVIQLTMGIQPADGLAAVATLYTGRPNRTAIAFSPDGTRIIFSARSANVQKLYVRPLDRAEATPIAGTDGGVYPVFSPDGLWVGFWADNHLKKVSLGGGPAVILCDMPVIPFGLSWGPNDKIVFSDGDSVSTVAVTGGTPQVIAKPDKAKGEQYVVSPQVLPGGQTVLFTVTKSSNWDDARIVTQAISGGERRVLVEGGTDARYVSSGHLLYMKSGTLMAIPFDAAHAQVKGAAVSILDGVMQLAGMPAAGEETGAGQFSVSDSGSLAYLTGSVFPGLASELVLVDRKGHIAPIPAPVQDYLSPRFSPDGKRIAVEIRKGTAGDIWILDVLQGTPTRLTFEGSNWFPLWSPDGKTIAYASATSKQILSIAADGGESTQSLTSGVEGAPSSWSADGKDIVFVKNGEIWRLPTDGDRKPEPVLQIHPFELMHPELSPDGQWLAYATNESNSWEVYVQRYRGGEKQRVSANFGGEPIWSKDGRELFFRTWDDLHKKTVYVTEIKTTPTFSFTPPRVLLANDSGGTTPVRGWDVSPDGQHFVMTRMEGTIKETPSEIHVILNWYDELRRRAPIQ